MLFNSAHYNVTRRCTHDEVYVSDRQVVHTPQCQESEAMNKKTKTVKRNDTIHIHVHKHPTNEIKTPVHTTQHDNENLHLLNV